jgi:hypothetical protein
MAIIEDRRGDEWMNSSEFRIRQQINNCLKGNLGMWGKQAMRFDNGIHPLMIYESLQVKVPFKNAKFHLIIFFPPHKSVFYPSLNPLCTSSTVSLTQ